MKTDMTVLDVLRAARARIVDCGVPGCFDRRRRTDATAPSGDFGINASMHTTRTSTAAKAPTPGDGAMTATVQPADVLAGLRELRGLLSDPDHWTQGPLARDKNGNNVDPGDPDACQWCLLGGVWKVADPMADPMIERALTDALRQAVPRPWWTPAAFNDHFSTTHAHVLAAVDRAIANAEKRVAA